MRKVIAIMLCALTALSLTPSVSASARNLALGKSVSVIGYVPNANSYGELDRFDPVLLTDGKRGKSDYSDPAWVKFYRGVGRALVVDLEEYCTVTSVTARFLHNGDAGVFSPEEITVFGSHDGVNFFKAEVLSGNRSPYLPSQGGTTKTADYIMEITPIRTKYIAIGFNVTVNTFIDEIEIFGEVGSDLPDILGVDRVTPYHGGKYLDRSALNGDTDIICFHAGYSEKYPDAVNNTEDAFLPYVGYLGADGKYTDTMFDSVLFLIYQGSCPSGGNLTVTGAPTLLSDWNALLDSYFSPEYNLSALDSATARLKQTLNLPDGHKTSVYLTMPYPKISDVDFGDYNGDGHSDKISTYEDCLAATRWFMDEVNRRWSQSDYKNLELKGYFCNNEGLTRQHYDYEEKYAKDACKMVQDDGLLWVMIPYYQAAGIEKGYDLGFDAMLMQPNLSFNQLLQDDPSGMMEDFAATSKQLGLGIQMEIADGVRWEPANLGRFYTQYLVSACENGLMTDTVHAYYNGAAPGVFYDCAKSNDKLMRWFYDATYKFIKGVLSLPEDGFFGAHTTDITVESGKRAAGDTHKTNGDWLVECKLTKQPKHGYVNFNDNGKFVYNADRNYQGDDLFEYEISVNGEVKSARQVNVTITGDVQQDTDASQSISEQPEQNKKSRPRVRAGIAAAAAIVAGAWFVLKRKRNR